MNIRRNIAAVMALGSLFVAAWLLPDAAASEEAREPAKPHAEMALSADHIDWQPIRDYEQVILTIAGPEGLRLQKEFADGQPASLSLYEQEGNRLPDGAYLYELRLVQRKVGPLSERPSLQAGSFVVRNGSFATAFEAAKPPKDLKSAQEPAIKNVTAATETIPDDLVVQGGACIGTLCGSGDASGNFLRLKGSMGLGIIFEDVFDQITYDRDWALLVNSGNENVSLVDTDAGTVPFAVWGGSPDYSLVVGSGGKIGIGTTMPGAKLHLYSNATSDVFAGMGPDPVSGPALNFGYAGASVGRGGAFFNVRPDASATAPNPSLRFMVANVERVIIDNQGYLGLGVANPSSPIQHSSGAILTAGGTWQNASSRDTKQEIAELAADEAFTTLQGLAPVKFAYKVDPNERHVGFIAEDVPDLVASPDRKSLSSMDLVAVLTKVAQEQQKKIDELSATLGELQAQLDEMKQARP